MFKKRMYLGLMVSVGLCVQMACSHKTLCSYICEPTQQRCIAEGLLLCTQSLTSGCYDWSILPCHPGSSCRQNGEEAACVKDQSASRDCTPKAYRKACVGQQIYWFDACGQRGDLVESCSTDKICREGGCELGQANPCGEQGKICARGERRCVSTQVQNCQWDAQKNCGNWDNPEDCMPNESCRDGYCQKDQVTCPNPCQIGSKRCVGVAIQTCEAADDPSCGQWGMIDTCEAGAMCVEGSCKQLPQNCPDSCALGARRCQGQNIEICQVSGSNCPAWQNEKQCPSNQICQGGKCIEHCQDQCKEAEHRCSGADIQICLRVDGCLRWQRKQSCGENQICQSSGNNTNCACLPGYKLSADGIKCEKAQGEVLDCGMNPEEKRVHEIVNQERATRGLAALACHTNIVSVSRDWSQSQCNRGSIGHDGFSNRLRAIGLPYSSGGENVAAGQTSPESVMRSWMNSSGHRNNILSSSFTHLGVGYVKCSKGYGHYWTQIFIRIR